MVVVRCIIIIPFIHSKVAMAAVHPVVMVQVMADFIHMELEADKQAVVAVQAVVLLLVI